MSTSKNLSWLLHFLAPAASAALLLLSGCAPLHETYYEPSSEGLLAHRQDCHAQIGPPREIDIGVGNSRIALWIERGVYLDLSFSVAIAVDSDGQSSRHGKYRAASSILAISPSEFTAYAISPVQPLRIKPGILRRINRGNAEGQPLPSKVELKAISPSIQENIWYVMHFDVELNGAREFSVVVPPFTVDGITVPSRTINFIEKSTWYISPLNC